MKFEPGLYVSQAMEAIGIKDRLIGWLAFATVALPIYLVGTLGLRVIGVPAILNAIFRPNPKSALRFILAPFRGDRSVNRTNVQHYAGRMDISIQPG